MLLNPQLKAAKFISIKFQVKCYSTLFNLNKFGASKENKQKIYISSASKTNKLFIHGFTFLSTRYFQLRQSLTVKSKSATHTHTDSMKLVTSNLVKHVTTWRQGPLKANTRGTLLLRCESLIVNTTIQSTRSIPIQTTGRSLHRSSDIRSYTRSRAYSHQRMPPCRPCWIPRYLPLASTRVRSHLS